MYSPLLLPERTRHREKGATLVVALTVVMVAGLLAISVSHDFLVLGRRVDNGLERNQVTAYLKGTESVARQVLLQDLQLSPEVDYSTDLWAETLELPLPEGTLKACMADLQGRINLNSLANTSDEGFSVEQRRFIRLLQALELEDPLTQAEAIALANAVFDWVDADDRQRFPGGAEDLYYYQQSPAGKAANQALASVSELRLVRGMTAEILAALTPHVTLWGNGIININGADRQFSRQNIQDDFVTNDLAAPVLLRTLNVASDLTPLPESQARQIANRRLEEGGFRNSDISDQGQLAGISLETEGLGLGSSVFLLISELETNGRKYQMQSVLTRFTDAVGVPVARVVKRKLVSNQIDLEDFCVN